MRQIIDAESLLLGYREIGGQIDPNLAEFGALPLSVLETHLKEGVVKRRDA
jgi:hypothetical protein